jgi:putative endonuclease
VGVTGALEGRVWQHKTKAVQGFTSKYNIGWLGWYGCTGDVREAIAMEKRIKGWTRARKGVLIDEMNPQWRDLSADWYDTEPSDGQNGGRSD